MATATAKRQDKGAAVEITGSIMRTFFKSEKFTAGVMDTSRGSVKFSLKGFVTENQTVTLLGHYVTHPKYGKQFEASEIVYKLPVDVSGLKNWLAWNIDSIGPAAAARLVDEFGADLPKLCQEDPGQVAATCGVKREAVEEIGNEWQKHSARVAVQSRLAGMGLTQHQVEVIVSKFKGAAADVVENRPYSLLGEVDGLGFAKVDEIALKVGIKKDAPERAVAALQWVVRGGYYDDGHTAMPDAVAIQNASDLISDEADVEAAAANLQAGGKLRKYKTGDEANHNYFASPPAVRAETTIREFLKTSTQPNPLTDGIDPIEFCSIELDGMKLDDSQSRAVRTALSHRVVVITGGAGSGKTLVAKAIHKVFTDEDVMVHLVAPTGKAARRLKEVIGASAATIHRTLGFNPDGGFQHNEENPLPDGLYIVDEVSMVDSGLMASFIRALPSPGRVEREEWDEDEEEKVKKSKDSIGSAVVLIGDVNQLPPVGPGAVLRDILDCDLAPAIRLEKCHRQAGVLKTNASAILRGHVEATDIESNPAAWIFHGKANDSMAVRKVISALYGVRLREWGFDPITDVQFMTAKHAGDHGTTYLNKYLQWIHQATLGVSLPEPSADDHKRPELYIGDKVIHTKNNYVLNVMNGTVGIVIETDPLTVIYDDGTVVYSDDNKGEVSLAYCLTPHKMQGSEVPCAVVIVPKSHGFMQTRNWLYTAATRAKKTCILVGDSDAIKAAAMKVDASRRETLLSVWTRYPETLID